VIALATALAHEIKNPAAVALAHVNLLRLDSHEDNNLTNHLNHIENAITDICELVQGLLTTEYDRELIEVDLHKILTDILETYRAAWPEISFTFDSGGNAALPCLGNATSLRMIFSNLIKNAVEAIELNSETTGVIVINTIYAADFLTVTITDTGTSHTEQKPHGNGLGLTICQNLAAGLGAQLFAAQTPEGGCAVTVKLRTRCPSLA